MSPAGGFSGREPYGDLNVDDNLVKRWVYEDGSIKSQSSGFSGGLSAAELKSYIEAPSKLEAGSHCVAIIARSRGISMLDAASILNTARYDVKERKKSGPGILSRTIKRLKI